MVKYYIQYSYEVKRKKEIRAEDAEKEKAAVLKRHPKARITMMTVFEKADEELGKAFLKATAPPGSVQRDDLKDRFGIDLDEDDEL